MFFGLTHSFRSVHAWKFFAFFEKNEGVPLNEFLQWNFQNHRHLFLYRLRLISNLLNKALISTAVKTIGRFDRKKIFFRLFYAETIWVCFSRRIFFSKFSSDFFFGNLFHFSNRPIYENICRRKSLFRDWFQIRQKTVKMRSK